MSILHCNGLWCGIVQVSLLTSKLRTANLMKYCFLYGRTSVTPFALRWWLCNSTLGVQLNVFFFTCLARTLTPGISLYPFPYFVMIQPWEFQWQVSLMFWLCYETTAVNSVSAYSVCVCACMCLTRGSCIPIFWMWSGAVVWGFFKSLSPTLC